MANNKKSNNVKKTASTLNSRWLQNTLKSMGVAGTEMIKDLMPATAETVSSATQVASDAINAVKSARTGAESLAKDIKNSSAIKMGQDFFKNALEDIKTGKAHIYSTVSGEYPQLYDIEILNIDNSNSKEKCMFIKIVDENLISKTGGIVQGMSGSPIIQNGKLIGAITHVLVSDSTKGYGIFIDLMT